MSSKGCLNYLKLSINHIVKLLVFLTLFSYTGFAQSDSVKSISAFVSDSTFVMRKSPLGAVLRSAVIPGWGQIYNHSYLKAPVIWGIGGWLVYLWIWNNKNYKDALNIYNLYNGKYVSSGNENYNNIALSYLKQKTFYQDQRDLVAIYIGLTYLLNVIDAYVDAEMYDFSFKENSVDKSPMLNLRIKF